MQGFITIAKLRETKLAEVPRKPGVFVVLRVNSNPVQFLDNSPAGHFKGKDPTVSLSDLQRNWIEDTPILYYGRSGNLNDRLGDFIQFGIGEPVGHWGGRLVWQIDGAEQFLIAWCTTIDYKNGKKELLRVFKSRFGKFPFANLQDGKT